MSAIVQQGTRYFRGAGVFRIDGRKLGQVSNATLGYEKETSEKENFYGGGGLDDTLTTYNKVTLECTCRSFDLENLAMVLGAELVSVTGSTVEDHPILAKPGLLVRIDGLIDMNEDVVIKDDSGTEISSDLYEASISGITITDDTISEDSELTVTYVQAAHTRMEGAVNQGIEGFMTLEGMNDAETGEQHVMDFYRVKSSPMESFDLIASEDQEVTITFDVLADSSKGKTGIPESKFFSLLQTGL